jgi:hypothetical protein
VVEVQRPTQAKPLVLGEGLVYMDKVLMDKAELVRVEELGDQAAHLETQARRVEQWADDMVVVVVAELLINLDLFMLQAPVLTEQ